jgi:hypothetical protein
MPTAPPPLNTNAFVMVFASAGVGGEGGFENPDPVAKCKMSYRLLGLLSLDPI